METAKIIELEINKIEFCYNNVLIYKYIVVRGCLYIITLLNNMQNGQPQRRKHT